MVPAQELAGSLNLGLELTIRHRTRSLWCGLSFQITQAILLHLLCRGK